MKKLFSSGTVAIIFFFNAAFAVAATFTEDFTSLSKISTYTVVVNTTTGEVHLPAPNTIADKSSGLSGIWQSTVYSIAYSSNIFMIGGAGARLNQVESEVYTDLYSKLEQDFKGQDVNAIAPNADGSKWLIAGSYAGTGFGGTSQLVVYDSDSGVVTDLTSNLADCLELETSLNNNEFDAVIFDVAFGSVSWMIALESEEHDTEGDKSILVEVSSGLIFAYHGDEVTDEIGAVDLKTITYGDIGNGIWYIGGDEAKLVQYDGSFSSITLVNFGEEDVYDISFGSNSLLVVGGDEDSPMINRVDTNTVVDLSSRLAADLTGENEMTRAIEVCHWDEGNQEWWIGNDALATYNGSVFTPKSGALSEKLGGNYAVKAIGGNSAEPTGIIFIGCAAGHLAGIEEGIFSDASSNLLNFSGARITTAKSNGGMCLVGGSDGYLAESYDGASFTDLTGAHTVLHRGDITEVEWDSENNYWMVGGHYFLDKYDATGPTFTDILNFDWIAIPGNCDLDGGVTWPLIYCVEKFQDSWLVGGMSDFTNGMLQQYITSFSKIDISEVIGTGVVSAMAASTSSVLIGGYEGAGGPPTGKLLSWNEENGVSDKTLDLATAAGISTSSIIAIRAVGYNGSSWLVAGLVMDFEASFMGAGIWEYNDDYVVEVGTGLRALGWSWFYVNSVSWDEEKNVWLIASDGGLAEYDGTKITDKFTDISSEISFFNNAPAGVVNADYNRIVAGNAGKLGVAPFTTSASIESTQLNSGSDIINSVSLTASKTLNSQIINYAVSVDGGSKWYSISSGSTKTLTSSTAGQDLRWKAALSGVSYRTPILSRINFYCTAAGTPTVSGLSSHSDYNRNSSFELTITGTDFYDGTTVKLSKGATEISASVTVNSTSSITATFNLFNKSTGAYSLTIKNVDNRYVALSDTFIISLMSINSISPNTGASTTTVSVNISGQYFVDGCSVKLKKGDTAISGSSVTIVSSTSITAVLNLTGRTEGTYDVAVTTGDVTATLTGGFVIYTPSSEEGTEEQTGTIGVSGGTVTVTNISSEINGTKVEIPANALTSTFTITINHISSPPDLSSGYVGIGEAVDLTPGGLEFAVDATITLPYTVPELVLRGTNPDNLKIFTYTGGSWSEVPDSSVDKTNKIVTAPVAHFSMYRLAAPVASNLSGAKAYPNPASANQPVKFVQLTAKAEIKIFTIAGLLVRELTADSSGEAGWNLQNDAGNKVSSGVYLCLINTASGETEVLKVAVIR